jgi:LacI family transcriptional regulator, repressor for deo operon, udp, cdd, tsx, nupC, and nupG
MGITIRDVAAEAGVSTATVSRALRGLPNVDEKTRERVKTVADRLDYVISPSASRLASGRTGSVAVITPYIARWFFGQILSGVESVLQEAGMDLLLMTVGSVDGEVQTPAAQRLRHRVDGALVLALSPDDEEFRAVLNLRMPTSLIGLSVPNVSSVMIDDVAAARIATQHLLNLGHRRIGIIGGRPSRPFTAEDDRTEGFRGALREAHVRFDPSLEVFGAFTFEGGERAMTELLSARERPTAVFAMSDEMAFGAIRALHNHGLTPGREVSLIGIDGHEMSELLNLTTVAQPVADLGRIATEALLAQITGQNGAPEAVRVPTQLIVRESTAPVVAR